MTNVTDCEDLAVWEENGKVRLDKAPFFLFLFFPIVFTKREAAMQCLGETPHREGLRLEGRRNRRWRGRRGTT